MYRMNPLTTVGGPHPLVLGTPKHPLFYIMFVSNWRIPEIIANGCFTISIHKELGFGGLPQKTPLCPVLRVWKNHRRWRKTEKHVAGTSATSAWKPKLMLWHRRKFPWGLSSGKLTFWTQRFYFQGLFHDWHFVIRVYFHGLRIHPRWKW